MKESDSQTNQVVTELVKVILDEYLGSTPEFEMEPSAIYFADETAFGPRFMKDMKGERMG